MNKVILLLISLICCFSIESQSVNNLKENWHHNAVIYQVYIRSYYDSSGNGIGDIPGVIQKLDYLQELGIDAIWLSPCFKSPMKDFGYDVSDYYSIEPSYGTMEDFEKLIKKAKKRNIKIIMDFVPNHTSIEHSWFLESKSSKDSLKRDWYLWQKSKSYKEPNNWTSLFGGSAWEFDKKSNEYYYHFFFKEQPDLNYRNPEVIKEMLVNIPKFWLNKGVAGFRLDAITNLLEDINLRDNPQVRLRPDGTWEQIALYNSNLEEVHELLKILRKTMDKYPGTILMGETDSEQYMTSEGSSKEKIEKISRYFGKNNDELHLVMNFYFAYIDKLSAKDFREQIELWDKNSVNGYPLYLFGNHDAIRLLDRYGDGKNDQDIAKLLATLLFTLRGTVQLYYGEEIGMKNNNPKKLEDIKDPVGKIFWPEIDKCRDGCRSPMQWNESKNSGFSRSSNAWLPVHSNYKDINLENQKKGINSIFNCYKKLIRLKKELEVLKLGSYRSIEKDNNNVLCYLREHKDQKLLVALNFTDKEQVVNFKDISLYGLKSIFSTQNINKDTQEFKLNPFEGYIGLLASK